MPGLMKDPLGREFLWFLERMLSTSPLAVLWTRVTEKMDLHVVLPTARHLINGMQNRNMRQLQRGACLSNVVGTSPWWEREMGDSRLSDRTCPGRRRTLCSFENP